MHEFEFELTTRVKTCSKAKLVKERLPIKATNLLEARVLLNHKLLRQKKEMIKHLGYQVFQKNFKGEWVLMDLREEVPVGKSRRLNHNRVLADICRKHNLNMVHKHL